jgi:hypothetical protein
MNGEKISADLFNARISGSNYVVKSTVETLERLVASGKIDDYTALRYYAIPEKAAVSNG